jgi:hypothetical protein
MAHVSTVKACLALCSFVVLPRSLFSALALFGRLICEHLSMRALVGVSRRLRLLPTRLRRCARWIVLTGAWLSPGRRLPIPSEQIRPRDPTEKEKEKESTSTA